MTLRPTPALLTANAVLTLGLASLWLAPSGQVRGVAWTAPAPVVPAIAPLAGIAAQKPADVSRFLAVLDRPLFSPNRRPAPPPAPVKAEAEVDPFANIQLQGVYSTGDGTGGIFARVDGKDRRITMGSVLGGWTVKGIDGLNVSFVREQDIRVVRLAPAKLATVTPIPTLSVAAPSGMVAGQSNPTPPSQDPILRQKQEQEDRERARLELRNARRIANGFPPLTSN